MLTTSVRFASFAHPKETAQKLTSHFRHPTCLQTPAVGPDSAVCALDEGDTDVGKFDTAASSQVRLLISEYNPTIPINERMLYADLT